MEIHELGDLELRPGRLTLWRANVPHPATWRADPRRPSRIQKEHLCWFGNGRPAWLGVAFEWSGEIDTKALSRAILVGYTGTRHYAVASSSMARRSIWPPPTEAWPRST